MEFPIHSQARSGNLRVSPDGTHRTATHAEVSASDDSSAVVMDGSRRDSIVLRQDKGAHGRDRRARPHVDRAVAPAADIQFVSSSSADSHHTASTVDTQVVGRTSATPLAKRAESLRVDRAAFLIDNRSSCVTPE